MHLFSLLLLLLPLLAISPLILASSSMYIFYKFHIRASTFLSPNCTSPTTITAIHSKKPMTVKEQRCTTFDEPFRSFSFQPEGTLHGEHVGKKHAKWHGMCEVKVYAGEKCGGEVLLDLEDGNGGGHFGKCFAEPFKDTLGKSVKVGKCTKRPGCC